MTPTTYAYLISLLAAFFIGIHLFTIKYLKITPPKSILATAGITMTSFALWLLSRYYIYEASSALPITTIHIVLNMSVIVSTLLSICFYKTHIQWPLFIMGIALVMGGVYCVERSVK
jgi:drug/metabolite transporter (DMT)-like permease